MKTLGDLLRSATSYLAKRRVARGRRVAEELLAHVLGIQRIELYMQFEKPLEEKEMTVYRAYIVRAARHEPWEYIVGKVEFGGLSLQVTPAVLIPRAETEILVDIASKELQGLSAGALWDIGTGSGCLGLALKKALPQFQVTLSDISSEALALARANGAAHRLCVECLQGDLLIPFSGRKAHVVVCNPPYVSEAEYRELDPSVRSFEPPLALIGGESGLEYYRRLAEELPPYLEEGARIFFEIGATQGKEVEKIFSAPRWHSRRVENDWSGHPRFFLLQTS